MTKITTFPFLLALSFVLVSCNLQDHPIPSEPDVYIAGNSAKDGIYSAKYWKNGKEVVLLTSSTSVEATGIAVAAGDVHVVGNFRGAGIYWKNGLEVAFENNRAPHILFDVKTEGPDVYLTGAALVPGDTASHSHAAYWKNGIPVLLEGGIGGEAWGIDVSGNDVYVAGNVPQGGYLAARYWKNGTPITLSDGTSTTLATSIAVSGNDVHVVGIEYIRPDPYSPSFTKAKYWKNGVEIPLDGWDKGSQATSVYVSGNEVMIAGNSDNGKAAYWKNGVSVEISGSAAASDLTIHNNVAYIAGNTISNLATTCCGGLYRPGSLSVGTANGGGGTAVYWRDGKQSDLSDGKISNVSSSIFVSQP
ncbi:hypothetical protein [Dyadobacter sp. BHUBP1]|uniref:hypothetical protein n=1 Tax=Dyadobacter sp. BHUBP1 TaxID=3424178 RepID=UPI003D32A529